MEGVAEAQTAEERQKDQAEERSHQGQKQRPWKKGQSQMNLQRSPAEQSKTKGELMQRTTPEGRDRRKGVTEKWEDPKATVESPNNQIGAQGMR